MRRIFSLKWTLGIKIGVTIIILVLPSLTFPDYLLTGWGFQPYLTRLLGVSYLALSITYIHGLRETFDGRFPIGAVLTGIASNGGALLIQTSRIWNELESQASTGIPYTATISIVFLFYITSMLSLHLYRNFALQSK
ncbi:MAG: hypothetical protein DWQ07_17315 [Chloroflexi bacterium]|nr:MAG: hypothetical protein DWQ07_17315 [Chloroflexota bacterium]MBL1195165.1 hypothetical protein [Chloroflexota bacterium]NOH12449.1 hypothetical protein [Chloroflexota bacterium]